ncbi:hypothetical protein LCGC14_0403350 [marine sediment metagenome]|uniref:Uncharacterized protein n=1 Tax=marine sediment metagenome TaxID=412755 RepID=A0A0F9TE37_9ZZZZ
MEVKLIALIVTPILGFIGWVTKHITNSQKHPCKKDIVFKDVCEAKQDCIESEIKNMNIRLDDIKADMKDGFERVERLIKNGK